MKLLDKIGREFSGYNFVESGKRLFDRKPLQCSLKKWIRKIRELGTMRIALVGGEPLVHPNIVEVVRYCCELGFATSLTTNGFLLTRKLVAELEDAGLQVMQISVDRMTPSPITKKSFKTILPKLDYFDKIARRARDRFVARSSNGSSPRACGPIASVSRRSRAA